MKVTTLHSVGVAGSFLLAARMRIGDFGTAIDAGSSGAEAS